MNEQVVMAIVGGAIGFVSSAGILALERILNRAGKLKLYYKFIHVKIDNASWGVRTNRGMYTLMIPVSFELQNTSNSTRVIRDLSIEAFQGEKQVFRMKQIERGEYSTRTGEVVVDKTTETYGGEKGSYSFALPPRSIQKQKCEYTYSINQIDAENLKFDTLKITYYDERDNKKGFIAKSDLNGWKMGLQKTDHDWILLRR